MDLHERAAAAESRIRQYVRETPLERSGFLSERAGCEVSLKLENFQETGSFKLRGVLSKLTSMSEEELASGIITASTGNHGLATAHASALLGVDAEIVVPEVASGFRLEALRRTGVATIVHGSECAESESWARRRARRTGKVFVSPYNDIEIVAGQGTIGIELERGCERVDLIVATVGGGGLLAGVAGALSEGGNATRALGCLPERSPAMYESIREGRIVRTDMRPTLSDSSAGNIEDGAVTFDLCKKYVDVWALVSEESILRAIELVYREHDVVIEGAAGVAVAGFLERIGELGLNRDAHVVIIVCGGNVSPDLLAQVVLNDGS